MKKISLILLFLLPSIDCVRQRPEPEVNKIVGCVIDCPIGYECDERENRCVPLPHSFSCVDSCPSDRYCSASGECKPNPAFCQMGQIPTKCNSNADCYAGQSCVDTYCIYPLCKCSSNSECDAINQICRDGVCDCFELGCKSNTDCPDDQVCVKNYPICGQCVPRS
ncbi:MAG: hypothetical protein N2746_00850 [Deltaproteobacteria bacterium]|nr:hypothetical protein [Deltaproteobacteria bacterium]